MKVSLLSYTNNPEKLIAAAAKLCYAEKADVDTLMDDLNDTEKVNSFINKLINFGHESPMEHVSFTFAIEGISRATSHQLVRHRIASYSQRSQRYCDESSFEYITSDSIRNNEVNSYTYKYVIDIIRNAYKGLLERGVKKEDARMLLPNATSTSIIVTMNLRSLYHFFNVRCCNRAQNEIREMANKMLVLCKKVSPLLFNQAGANCIQNGYCPEGKMSCGMAPTLDELITTYKTAAKM